MDTKNTGEKKQKRKRDANAKRVIVHDSDVALFKLAYEYRLLRRDHFSALTGRPGKRLHRRLLELVQAGYLTTIKQPQQKHIYAIGQAARHVLIENGIADPELLEERSRVHELK